VSALSGYVGPSQEESLIFVIMMNHFAGASSTAARNKQDEIAAALARLTQ
jgi:D-alanyl-D-alanine carboxypeptidase